MGPFSDAGQRGNEGSAQTQFSGGEVEVDWKGMTGGDFGWDDLRYFEFPRGMAATGGFLDEEVLTKGRNSISRSWRRLSARFVFGLCVMNPESSWSEGE